MVMFNLRFLRPLKRKRIQKDGYAILSKLVENLGLVNNPVCEFHMDSKEKWIAGLLVVVFVFTMKKYAVLNKRKKFTWETK